MGNGIVNVDAMGLDLMPGTGSQIPDELSPAKMNDNKKGISETLDAVKFLCAAGVAVKNSLSDDGKITVSDSLKFFTPISKLPAVIVGIKDIPAELSDTITEEEQAEIIKVIEESGIASEEAESAAIEILPLVLGIKNFIFKHFVKN